jgi:hypothetical protein
MSGSDVFATGGDEAMALALELEFLCSLSRRAILDLEAAVGPFQGGGELSWNDYLARIWLSIIGLVVIAGSISRLLWPVADPSGAAGRLRRALGPGTLIRNREMRNALEHLDETVHSMLMSPTGPSSWQLTSGEPGDPTPGDVDDEELGTPVRDFNVTTFDLTVRRFRFTETLNLRELAIAVNAFAGGLERARQRHLDRLTQEEVRDL